MEYTNEILEEIQFKKDTYNSIYSNWYYGMSNEFLNDKYKKRSERIGSCLNLWQWDKYEKNKLLDLQRVNRCSNNRFCPNCKLLDISKFIHKFKEIYTDYLNQGYHFYMLTLTIPSVPGSDLRSTLDKLSKSFRKFTEKYVYDISDRKSFKDRIFNIEGGIKVLEITYNSNNGFHPHYHCVVYTNYKIPEELLRKFIKGKYSNKKKCFNYKSLIDIEISKLWSMIWYGERLSQNNIDSIDFYPRDEYFKEGKKVLETDFIELDESGIYEVFKYTFKDTDIENYYVFKTLVQALEGKRIRQGFGTLFNIKCEDIEDGELQELSLIYEENPESLLTFEINELVTTYRNYKKISRFNRQIDNNIKF